MLRQKCESSSRIFSLLLVWILVIAIENGRLFRFSEAGKRRIHIADDLDDVVDSEEDEAWKEWGKSSTKEPEFDPPPTDFSGMSEEDIQAEMMKRQFGPVFGFVKLAFSVPRTRETVSDIALKWTKISRTGSTAAQFMGVDLNTIMFNMQNGKNSLEFKDFILSQPEAYEVKLGDALFRRPGDPPFEEAYEKKHRSKEGSDKMNSKDEL